MLEATILQCYFFCYPFFRQKICSSHYFKQAIFFKLKEIFYRCKGMNKTTNKIVTVSYFYLLNLFMYNTKESFRIVLLEEMIVALKFNISTISILPDEQSTSITY